MFNKISHKRGRFFCDMIILIVGLAWIEGLFDIYPCGYVESAFFDVTFFPIIISILIFTVILHIHKYFCQWIECLQSMQYLTCTSINSEEETFSVMFSNIDEMISIYDMEQRKYIYVNNYVHILLGYKPEEFMQMTSYLDIIHPDDRGKIINEMALMEAQINKEDYSPCKSINRILHKNGRIVILEIISTPVKKNNSVQIIEMTRDITDRIKMEQNLKTSERIYRDIVENSYNVILMVDNKGIITYMNQAVKQQIRHDPYEFIGKKCLSYIHPEDKSFISSLMYNISEENLDFSFRILLSSDEIYHVNAHSSPFYTEDKKLKGTIVIATNISKDIIMKKTINFQTRLLESMQESILTFDIHGKIKYYNPKASSIFNNITEGSLLEDIGLNNIFSNIDKIKEIISTGEGYEEQQLLAINGQNRTFLHSIHPFYEHQRIEQIILISTDISDLIEAQRTAETANIAKSQFLANMSHELRTPIIGILASVEIFEQNSFRSREDLDNIETIKQCSEHLLNIINEILNVSKIESGLETLNNLPGNICETIKKSISNIEPIFKEKSLYFEFSIAPDIPEILILDQLKLQQIITKLLYNAVKFTPKGVIRLKADFIDDIQSDNKELLISIEDTGVGIPGEKIDTIFNRFTQADNSPGRKFGGTGLGLYICNKLTELMGGKIMVESTEGSGSSFSLKIPVREPAPDEFDNDISNENIIDLEGSTTFHPISVLLVEDNELNKKLVAQMLNNYGFEVETAANGLECLEKMRLKNIDLILMDMQMPLMDGYETTTIIRATPEWPFIPIIAITANAMDGDREKCLACGCSSYLAKPFKSQTLVQEIKNQLGRNFFSEKKNNTSTAEELINELIPEFIVLLKDMLNDLKTSIERNDIEKILYISHSLKGTAGMYGFVQISEIAANIEQLSREENIHKLEGLYDQLHDIYQQFNNSTALQKEIVS